MKNTIKLFPGKQINQRAYSDFVKSGFTLNQLPSAYIELCIKKKLGAITNHRKQTTIHKKNFKNPINRPILNC